MDYIDSYYRRSLRDPRPRPRLEGRVEAEVCVVGGGLAGVTAAYALSRMGKDVVLLEGERVGWGASGRNGGFVSPGFATGRGNIARRAGKDGAAALHRLSIEGMRFVRDRIDALGIEGADPVHGILSALRHDGGDSLKEDRDTLAREFGYEVEFLPTGSVRERLRSRCYFQALRDPNAFHFHPLNYVRGLARAAEGQGARIFEGSRAVSADLDGAVKVVRTDAGEVAARDVLVCGGGYTDRLVPELRQSMLPIATYVLLTERAPERIAEAIRTTDAIGDNRRAGDYYRVVDGGERILWGGKITTRTAEPRNLAELLRQTMVSTYPQLDGVNVEVAWSGLMSYARHLMPQIGRLRHGVWYATAFGGHGMNTSTIGGLVIAEGIAGESDRYRLFEPFGLDWNGGRFGHAAVQMTYWWLQAQDRWRERRVA
ncbi:putative oxidoreductase protein [Rubellimicrobium mesophilum DSM 19309]|uniref:Putative oxidoreductase protein n=1 Tax=Rubellimicrobium mesophilum DSM 19309 TaxID=442562 RepID=A0A017HP39_9RHOB|nr:FAD-binding oxidoreductase [Rubellimicrobium mesophilum]EYD76141.1 putative oxidoreductase protein [Rubellimicrobium mesophilum DSM 19309]